MRPMNHVLTCFTVSKIDWNVDCGESEKSTNNELLRKDGVRHSKLILPATTRSRYEY